MKKLALLSISILFSVKIFSCGGGEWYYEDTYYNFFNQFLLADKSLHPFLHCPYSAFCTEDESVQNLNLLDWQTFFDNEIELNDIKEFFYNSSIDDLTKLQNALNGVTINELDNNKLKNNKLYKYLKKKKDDNIIAYMIFAKKCEDLIYIPPYSWHQGENWDSQTSEGPDYYNTLIEEGKALYKKQNNKFLKSRLGFQLVRLAHYNKEHQKAVDFFNEYLEKLNVKNYIYYRTLEQKAGALKKLNRYVDSSIDFIKVFEKLPDRRAICLQGISINSQNRWNSVAEKTNYSPVLYFIRAFKNGSELNEMERIIEHTVNSPYLDAMMLRYLNKIEASKFSRYDYAASFDQQKLEKFNYLVSLVKDKKTENKELWTLAQAYTFMFVNQYDTARTILREIKQSSTFSAQARVLDFVIKSEQVKDSLNAETCNDLFVEFNTDKILSKDETIKNYLMHTISQYYKTINDKVVAGLCIDAYDFNEGRYSLIDFNAIAQFESFFTKNNPNELEKFLIEKAPKDIQEILTEMRATYFLRNYKAELAYNELKKLPKDFTARYFDTNTKVNYGPNNDGFSLYHASIFSGAIRHYFSGSYHGVCDNTHLKFNFLQDENSLTNKTDLARLIMELEEKASKKTANSALYFYMLGNVLYNLGPDGWFRNILQFREDDDYYKPKGLYSFSANYDTNIAIGYYQQALKNTNDKELQAKIYYMMAKTVQYAQNYPPLYSQSFKLLKEKYKNTQYYKEVINECEYFDKYINPEKYKNKN